MIGAGWIDLRARLKDGITGEDFTRNGIEQRPIERVRQRADRVALELAVEVARGTGQQRQDAQQFDGPVLGDDPETAHDLVERWAERHRAPFAQGLDLDPDEASRVGAVGDDVDATSVSRGRHHVPAHQRQAIGGKVHADVADYLLAAEADKTAAEWSPGQSSRRGFKPGLAVKDLPDGAVVATSSTRRQAQLLALHPRLKVTDLRGNVVTRLCKLAERPELDATVLALAGLSRQRIKDKPFTVTEYQHPSPNYYGAEGPLLLAAYGGLQDWDGLWLFDYGHGNPGGATMGYVRSYFEIGQHPTKMANLLLAANLFRRGDTLPAAQEITMALTPDKELGLLLINAGYVSQEDILASLQHYFTGVVRRLFTWVEGFFRFEPDSLPPVDRIGVRVDLENLIIEGSRQLREWEQLQEEIPSLEMALKFTDRPLKNVNLSVEEWRVVSYINPRNTMKQIAQTNKMNDLDVRRIVYGLLQAGLVEIIRPEGVVVPVSPKTFPTQDKEEQKSLVNKLIGRIRSL